MNTMVLTASTSGLRAFFLLCKPKVTALIVFTAMIGMLLATPGLPSAGLFLAATVGIGLASGAAAACNCLIERRLDARMARTRGRPLPRGDVTPAQTLAFAALAGGSGLALLGVAVNPLTMALTAATFVGYAVIYTVFLKPATPLNIVIGGASGAMPPVLGWCAVTGSVDPGALLLFLIIFAWTPPHFWALALYRRQEYANVGIPMLPVTHGEAYTRLHILLYTVLLTGVTLLPAALGSSGVVYLAAALVLDALFLRHAVGLWRRYSDHAARRCFKFSIVYLFCLFAALLADHYAGWHLPA